MGLGGLILSRDLTGCIGKIFAKSLVVECGFRDQCADRHSDLLGAALKESGKNVSISRSDVEARSEGSEVVQHKALLWAMGAGGIAAPLC